MPTDRPQRAAPAGNIHGISRIKPALNLRTRRWAEYLDPVLLRRGHDPLHVGRCFRRNGPCLRRIARGSEETFVLGSSDVEDPRSFGLYLEKACATPAGM